jgi:hypothetical protein
MAEKVRRVGLKVETDIHLGSVVYPAFWALKKRNRIRLNHLSGTELEERVRRDYGETKESLVFDAACRFERGLLRRGMHLPFGIRGLTVVRRPPRPA